jgi:polyadenylate-binding protein
LRKLFEKYGEIISASVSRDEYGYCKGFGYVCFVNPINAGVSFREMNEKKITFPGCLPLQVNFFMNKEERQLQLIKETNNFENCKFVARLVDLDANIVIFN